MSFLPKNVNIIAGNENVNVGNRGISAVPFGGNLLGGLFNIFGGTMGGGVIPMNEGYEDASLFTNQGMMYPMEMGYGQGIYGGYEEYGMERGCEGHRHHGGGESFMESMLTVAGLGAFIGGILSLFNGNKAKQIVPTAQTVQSNQIQNAASIYDTKTTNKYEQLSNWEYGNILGQNKDNFNIVRPEFKELIDAYHKGGDKDKTLFNKALEIYTKDITAMGEAEMAKYDKDKNGSLDYTEFVQKSMAEAKRDYDTFRQMDPKVVGEFDYDQALEASNNAFKHLSHDGKTITAKDFAAMYSLADMETQGHDGKCKGNISRNAYEAVSTDIGKGDITKDSKGNEVKNEIKDNIAKTYEFLFPSDEPETKKDEKKAVTETIAALKPETAPQNEPETSGNSAPEKKAAIRHNNKAHKAAAPTADNSNAAAPKTDAEPTSKTGIYATKVDGEKIYKNNDGNMVKKYPGVDGGNTFEIYDKTGTKLLKKWLYDKNGNCTKLTYDAQGNVIKTEVSFPEKKGLAK